MGRELNDLQNDEKKIVLPALVLEIYHFETLSGFQVATRYVNPWPVRGRFTRSPAGAPAVLGSDGMCPPAPRDQPEARTNSDCSITGQVRRICEDWTYAVSEAARRLVCMWVCGGGRDLRDEPREQSFV